MNSPQPVVFMLDTNILIRWMQAYQQDATDANLRIRSFCENASHTIVVPDIVWVELISCLVHKNILLGADWDETCRNFRNNQTMVQQLEQLILNRPNWLLQWHPDDIGSVFNDSCGLMQENNFLTERLYNQIKKNPQKTKDGMDCIKLLDGMDSAILMYLNALASGSPDKQFVMYTADYLLFRITESVSRENKSRVVDNFKSVFALFSTLRCRICRHDNPVSVLSTPDMWCENSDRQCHRIKL